MAAVNIVLADAQGTPVNHTFVPLGPDKDGVFWFEDQSQASPIGFWRISYQLKRPPPGATGQSSSQRTYRAAIGLHEPILENVTNNTVSGIAPAPTIAYSPRCFVEYVMPERTALLDRKNLRKMTYNLQNEAQLIALVENLVTPF
ncbi:coat protein [ssRNA phage SRR7976357_6]|uniref:Coat protein n=1 Tax=ssRNA phage SRR7976357_6 TaxID=2786746 RepID=A0A8S5L5R1_9VIRU|nr:coat protein [ssRNA phage SRR7976357_6]DAD52823.1 TPA_asm: coat protein [ssRNA phage SRR7976357_6]